MLNTWPADEISFYWKHKTGVSTVLVHSCRFLVAQQLQFGPQVCVYSGDNQRSDKMAARKLQKSWNHCNQTLQLGKFCIRKVHLFFFFFLIRIRSGDDKIDVISFQQGQILKLSHLVLKNIFKAVQVLCILYNSDSISTDNNLDWRHFLWQMLVGSCPDVCKEEWGALKAAAAWRERLESLL